MSQPNNSSRPSSSGPPRVPANCFAPRGTIMGQQHLLIPARFLLTTGHLVAVIMAYFNHETNLDAGLGANPSGGEYGKEKEKVRGDVAREREERAHTRARAPCPRSHFRGSPAHPHQVVWFIIGALICHGFDFMGMLFGTSLFFTSVNLLQVIAHFFGGTIMAIYIEQAWQYQYLFYIIGFCNFTTALAEIGVLIAMYGLKIVIF